jgi:hypothetical protein
MQLSKFLGMPVIDAGAHPVGTVVDVRLTLAGDPRDHPPTPCVLGLLVSPRTGSWYLGYERSDINAPKMLAALSRWQPRHVAGGVGGHRPRW